MGRLWCFLLGHRYQHTDVQTIGGGIKLYCQRCLKGEYIR